MPSKGKLDLCKFERRDCAAYYVIQLILIIAHGPFDQRQVTQVLKIDKKNRLIGKYNAF